METDFQTREHSRESLLEKVKSDSDKKRLTLHITCFPVLQNIRMIL